MRRLATPLLLAAALAAAGALAGEARDDIAPEELAALRAELGAVLANPSGADRFDAEVWLTALEPRLVPFLDDAAERLAVLGIVWREAARHDIDPEFALALIEVESSFRRFAVSSAGAQGLMQVMPFWKHELGRDADNLTEPVTNVRYGMTILAHYLERERGDVVAALTRYHGDRDDLSYPRRVFRAWNERWRTRSLAEVHELVRDCYAARLDTCDQP